MSLTTAGVNIALNALTGASIQASLHTGAPGDTGSANEVAGAGYARQAATLAASAAKVRTLSNAPVFTIPPGNNITHYSIFIDGVAIDVGVFPVAQNYPTGGTCTLASGSISIS